jgi:hypothetical protein
MTLGFSKSPFSNDLYIQYLLSKFGLIFYQEITQSSLHDSSNSDAKPTVGDFLELMVKCTRCRILMEIFEKISSNLPTLVKNFQKTGESTNLVLFANRTKPGTVLIESVLSGESLYTYMVPRS